jgi:hypothetical protein
MTKLEIFNRALAEIGHDRTIPAIDSTMTENQRCLLAWDGARIAVLTAAEWNWLVAETALTDGAICEDDEGHLGDYFWNRPADYLRLLAVVGEDSRRVDWSTANGLIYSKAPAVKMRYLPDSEDPEDWPQQIADAVTYELAARISLPMSASGKTMVAMKQLSAASIAQAMSHDSAEMRRAGSSGRKYADSRR